MKKKNNNNNILLKGFVGVICAVVGLAILYVLFGGQNETIDDIFFSLLILLPFLLSIFTCINNLNKSLIRKIFGSIGLVLNVICYFKFIFSLIWDIEFLDFITFSLYFKLLLGCITFSLSSLLLIVNNNNKTVKIAQYGTIGLLSFIFVSSFEPLVSIIYNDVTRTKLIIIEVLLIVLGLIVTPILNVIHKNEKVK